MTTYETIVVGTKAESWEMDDKRVEYERYMYGRFFFLGSDDSARAEGGTTKVFYLVERHYADQIIPRMASGLIWARKATFEERHALGLAS